jgi:signal transduction histidine kinase
MPDSLHPRVLDLWVALLAGERVWHDGPIQPGPRERIAAAFALIGAGCTVSVIWVAVGARFDPWNFDVINTRRAALLGFAVLATLAGLALGLRYQRIVHGTEAVGRPVAYELLWRSTAFLLLATVLAGALPRAHIAAVVPLGVLAGADASLTLWALGITPRARVWVWRFLVGPVHFGVLGALIAVAVFGGLVPALGTVVGLYLAMWTGLVMAGMTVAMINRLAVAVDDRVDEERHDALADERARRAHWLHDDVLSEVHLASLRISSGSATPEQINAELLDLDHRLRLRQLDDMMSAGNPRVYEILQPHLRRAQNLGVALDHVPTHEVTRLEVDEECGQILNRAVSILMSNAVNAGARRLSIDMQSIDGGTRLQVRITDDAGGFDLATVPVGRGLHSLIDQVGVGAVQRYDVDGGSMVVVTVPRHCADRTPPADAEQPSGTDRPSSLDQAPGANPTIDRVADRTNDEVADRTIDGVADRTNDRAGDQATDRRETIR